MSASVPNTRGLLVVTDTLAGGMGALVRAQCAWFARRGWAVTLLAPDDGPAPDAPTVHTVIPAVQSARRVREMLAARRAVRAAWRANAKKSTVVHVHGLRSFLLARAAGLPKPFVSVHGAHPSSDDPAGYHLVRRLWFASIPRFARGATSGEPTTAAGWAYRPFVSPLLGHLDVLRFPPTESRPTFAWLGLLDDRKRPEVFVRAIAAVASDGVEVCGLLAGAGPRAGEIAALIEKLDAPVTMLGQADAVDVLTPAWALCLFARSEGTPLAVMEAMWAGRSVIASDRPGIRYLVGDTGSLADDVAVVAAAMRNLATDPALAARRGAAAATRIRTLINADTPWPEFERAYTS
ncbi:MAG: hypothetical protein QOJ00_2842 [Actinomycetota bacterium]